MEEEQRIAGPESQRTAREWKRFPAATRPRERPRRGVVAVDVLPYTKFGQGESTGKRGVETVIGIEDRQLPVVDLPVDAGELPDDLDGRVLPVGKAIASCGRIEVAERR